MAPSSPARPCFPSPEIRFLPVLPVPDFISSLFIPSTTSFPFPLPYPFPLPFPRRSASHFLCVFVCWRIVSFGLSCQGYRVRVDHLVIDKRMQSGEAGKLNSPRRIDSTVPHDKQRPIFYSITVISPSR